MLSLLCIEYIEAHEPCFVDVGALSELPLKNERSGSLDRLTVGPRGFRSFARPARRQLISGDAKTLS